MEIVITMKKWRLSLFMVMVVIIILLGVGGVYLGLITPIGLSKRGNVLIPNQITFRSDENDLRAVRFLAQKWGVTEDQIYIIVQDSEPWMQVLGLLDLQTMSSARIWIIDTSYKEGQAEKVYLTRQGIPHEGNIYLVSEYRPLGEKEKALVTKFYSTPTFWYGSPLGGLAIIEDIRWTDTVDGRGSALAYQSQKYLPSITIPIEDYVPQKWKAFQTPKYQQ